MHLNNAKQKSLALLLTFSCKSYFYALKQFLLTSLPLGPCGALQSFIHWTKKQETKQFSPSSFESNEGGMMMSATWNTDCKAGQGRTKTNGIVKLPSRSGPSGAHQISADKSQASNWEAIMMPLEILKIVISPSTHPPPTPTLEHVPNYLSLSLHYKY